MKRKILSVFLVIISVFSLFGCSSSAPCVDIPLTGVIKQQNSEIVNDIDGDTTLDDTIKYASSVNDVAQSYYANSQRTAYVMKNSDITLVQSLEAKNNGATLYNADGIAFFENTFDVNYGDFEKVYYAADSETEGRVNTVRLGEYYRECHIRDYSFNETVKVDKTFHLYGDRLYSQFTLMSEEPLDNIGSFACTIKIPQENVLSAEFKDQKGIHKDVDNGEWERDVEYIAFDIKDAGVLAFILPSDTKLCLSVVKDKEGFYTISLGLTFEDGKSINDVNGNGNAETNSLTFGFRIFTDEPHDFETVQKIADIERNPLENITVNGGNGEGAFLGYDSFSGFYNFSMKGTDFNTAYQNPDIQYSLPLTITNDSLDREIYIRSNGDNGCLEAAALLDDTGTLVPVNVQVCKNFHGDGGEPFYSADDPQYGDSIFPVTIKADETIDLTLLNIYQNWGKYPLKQLSSIEFHVSYYHLSTGTTESNCIAPYFVFGKDGWTLPDFRTASGNMWEEQPQFNSVGILKFMTYRQGKNDVYSEYMHSDIESVGQTYSDITNTFFSDDGTYKYTLRHVEFPQTDENRTYYTLNVEFLEDKTFDNFREDFDLFYFDGRFVCFDKIGFLDAENNPVTKEVDTSKKTQNYVLGDNAPYWGFYDVTDDTAEELDKGFGANFSMIIKNSNIIIDGKSSEIPFVFRESSEKAISKGALTLDAEELTFRKGDIINIDMILLPWGTGTEENDDQVLAVREDSALYPVTTTATIGTVVPDAFIPVINCENNTAEFSVKGGKGNIAVRVNGFTEISCPEIQKMTENGWEPVEIASSNGYDGYTVFYNDDGTYGFSFVYNSQSVTQEQTFRMSQ